MTLRPLVYGLGVTGRAVAAAISDHGGEPLLIDDRVGPELAEWASARGFELVDGSDLDSAALAEVMGRVDSVQPAPGLPDHHPVFAAAAETGVAINSEFDLAARWDDRPVVAVTATDGKTTVVTLITAMLNRSGVNAVAVGNTETPWVQAIQDPAVEVFVVEASSFRLAHSAEFTPWVAVWLNFGPDHLDAHRDLAAYRAAKAKIWSQLGPDGLAIANRDDPVVSEHAAGIETGRVETFGAGPGGPHRIQDGRLIVADEPLVEVAALVRSLPHDLLNGLAASAAALGAGATRQGCAQVLTEFAGLANRVELVAEIDGVRWVNDSKATTPHASAAALGGYDSTILLAGGRNKGLSFDPMTRHRHRVKHLVALGEAADEVRSAFGSATPATTATSMGQAVEIADRLAEPGDVVLLSPACASFDWYRNYAARGDDFRRLVFELSDFRTGGTR